MTWGGLVAYAIMEIVLRLIEGYEGMAKINNRE